MFHAATAALLGKDIKRHSHQGLISAFGQFLVKQGQVESRFHKYIAEAFDLRFAVQTRNGLYFVRRCASRIDICGLVVDLFGYKI
jgi:uncharacterized protein (UPF0332 family)